MISARNWLERLDIFTLTSLQSTGSSPTSFQALETLNPHESILFSESAISQFRRQKIIIYWPSLVMDLRSLVGRYFSNLSLISTGKLLRLEFIVKLSDLDLLLIFDLWNKVKMKNHVTEDQWDLFFIITEYECEWQSRNWTGFNYRYYIWFTSRW